MVLQRQYRSLLALAPYPQALSAAHKALPPLLSGIVRYTSTKKPMEIPSLFDLYGNIYMCSVALEALSDISSTLFLPKFPDEGSGTHPRTISLILSYLANPELSLPFNLKHKSEPLPSEVFNKVGEALFDWITQSLMTMSIDLMLVNRIPEWTGSLQIIRGLSFLYAKTPASFSEDNGLYQKAFSIFASYGIQLYSCHVLQPTINKLAVDLQKSHEGLSGTLNGMKHILESWTVLFPKYAAKAIKVCESYVAYHPWHLFCYRMINLFLMEYFLVFHC